MKVILNLLLITQINCSKIESNLSIYIPIYSVFIIIYYSFMVHSFHNAKHNTYIHIYVYVHVVTMYVCMYVCMYCMYVCMYFKYVCMWKNRGSTYEVATCIGMYSKIAIARSRS